MVPRRRRASLSPTIRKSVIGLTLAVLLFVGGFVVVGYSPLLNIEKIEVYGLHHLTLEEIEERLGFEPGAKEPIAVNGEPVSYTHLTLPTILLV